MRRRELLIFLGIIGVGAFFRLYQLDLFPPGFETHAWSLRIFSGIVGILTIVGLYLLVKQLFEWQLSAVASFLLAVSFWHVNFSRTGFGAIMLPFILVWTFYFLWKGLKHNHLLNFFVAGIFGGVGFYTDISYRIAPLIAVVLFINYWWYLKKDFDHNKYEHSKTKLLQGFVLMALTAFIVALPIGFYFWGHSQEFFSPLNISAASIVKTLGMFNFSGDWNPGYNIPGSPMLPWPIGIFFAVGFINELIHWLKHKHGHLSTAHTFLFAWFFVMLFPGFLSTDAPNALRTIGVIPVVMIFTAKGIMWFFDKLNAWYHIRDTHSKHESRAITATVMIIFLTSVGFLEYWRYFQAWGPAPETSAAFRHSIKK